MKTKILFIFLLVTTFAAAQSGLGFLATFNVTFETGKYTISKEQRKMVKAFALGHDPKDEIGIMGFSDSTGTSENNDTLSIRRARALRDCIHEFSPKLEIQTFIGERDTEHLTLPQEQQRRAFVIIGLKCVVLEESLKFCDRDICAFPKYLIPVKRDSIKKASLVNKPEIAIRDYGTSREKISAGINAIAANNDILKAVAIADICIDDYWVAWQGYEVSVRAEGKMDSGLKVYIKKDAIWQETNIPIKSSNTKSANYYRFKVPDETGCFSFCLGKPAKIKRQTNGDILANSYKTVFIGTFKPFNFKDVNVVGKQNSLSYSAKLNDSLMAFTLPAYLSARQMIFNCLYDENGTEKPLTVSLAKCTYSKDKDGNDHYLITEESLMEKAPAKKKKGFWQWLKDLF